jgi:hypothetical protein
MHGSGLHWGAGAAIQPAADERDMFLKILLASCVAA